jgi:hypothetical protein
VIDCGYRVRKSNHSEKLGELKILAFKCKFHMMPILMHQMRILTTYVSSEILGPKNLEIRNVITVKTQGKKPKQNASQRSRGIKWSYFENQVSL